MVYRAFFAIFDGRGDRDQYDDPTDHLEELEGGDDRRNGSHQRVKSGIHHEVIRIHDGVDGEVHRGEPQSGGDCVVVRMPAVKEYGYVMEPVQENDGLLSQHKEGSVDLGEKLVVDRNEETYKFWEL